MLMQIQLGGGKAAKSPRPGQLEDNAAQLHAALEVHVGRLSTASRELLREALEAVEPVSQGAARWCRRSWGGSKAAKSPRPGQLEYKAAQLGAELEVHLGSC